MKMKIGQTLFVIFLALLFLLPLTFLRAIARENLENFSTGNGRMWFYVTKIITPTFFQFVFPFSVIFNNSKMWKSLRRDFLESSLWRHFNTSQTSVGIQVSRIKIVPPQT